MTGKTCVVRCKVCREPHWGWILQDISSSLDLLMLLTNLGMAVVAGLAAGKAQHGRSQGYHAQYRDPNSYHQPQLRFDPYRSTGTAEAMSHCDAR